jgi:predicted AAA+ superfamily ATPase
MLRKQLTDRIELAIRHAPVVALLGPRQSGKTTLARQFAASGGLPFDEGLAYFDLEDPRQIERLVNARLALEPLRGLVVVDEVQRRPDLFPLLRVLADREGTPARFLILGSASRDLIRQSSESLAGRIHFIDVMPFSLEEAGAESVDTLWIRGGFPPSFLAESDQTSWDWRANYIRTFLERDVPELGIRVPPLTLRRFWMMLAHYHGQLFNASEIGKNLGVAHTTIARYLDILTGTLMVRALPPWLENIGKRQIKTPKIFFRDTGILHRLIDTPTMAQLAVHPRLGASWEGFAVEHIIRALGVHDEEAFFWGIHNQAELDLLVFGKGGRLGFEVKYTDAPRATRSQHAAMDTLGLESITLVVPGDADYPLADRVRVLGLSRIPAVGLEPSALSRRP